MLSRKDTNAVALLGLRSNSGSLAAAMRRASSRADNERPKAALFFLACYHTGAIAIQFGADNAKGTVKSH
jgi:hypothetical protein